MGSAYVAGGNILPSRFVKLSTTANNTVLQAGANDPIIGVSYQGSDRAPLDDLVSTAYAGRSGEHMPVYESGEVCLVQAGGSITAGQRLKSDANAKAVAVATTGTTIQECGAIALSSGADGELIRVKIDLNRILPAVS